MRKPTDLRQDVLQASLALIEEGGLDRLSMREVARKAGVSHQAPYHYFGDREAILAALAGEGFSRLGQSLARAAADAGEPGDAVVAMGKAYVDFAIRHPPYFQVMFRADAVALDRYPEARKQENEAFGKLVEEIDKAFTSQAPEERRRIAVAVWAMVHGLATLILEGSLARKVGVPKLRQKQLAYEVIATFAGLLKARGA
ncbi:MAG TPA: TetR/AcrR family transcriptional regulator [Methyloceanibacter sp.]|jgi:Transcriptional regulator|nr:TetR/AcrR family transcriptional regulator [Methyloceanibacter sp.]